MGKKNNRHLKGKIMSKKIEELTIKEAKERLKSAQEDLDQLNEIFGNSETVLSNTSDEPQDYISQDMIGTHVIVRARDAGVHAGTLVSHSGRSVRLSNSRRLYYWKSGGSEHTLSGVARHGLADDGNQKIAGPLDALLIMDACEIIPTTSEAEKSINGYKVYNA